MNAAILDIQSRKQLLVAECAAQRAALSEAWRGLERPLTRGKQAASRAASRLRSPWLWLGIGLIAFKLPLRRFSRIPILLFKGWRMAQKIQSMIR